MNEPEFVIRTVKASPEVLRRKYYQRYLATRLRRFNVLVCHRRFGKTVFAINQLIGKVAMKRKAGLTRPRGYYVAPLFRQAKQVSWDYLLDATKQFPDLKVNQAELRVDFLGDCRVQLLGADNPDSARGIYADEGVFDEYGQMNPKMWTEVFRPALSDRMGGATFIGTPQGRNGFHRQYKFAMRPGNKEWYGCLYRASKTNIITPTELASAREEMAEEEYQQEFECSWTASILGAYYSKLLNGLDEAGRISDKVIYDPALPVITAWDLGMDDETSIWFVQQDMYGAVRVIDYYSNNNEGLEHYVKVLSQKPYTYSENLLPHDAAVRELGTGRSRLEVLRSLGLNGRIVPRSSIEDGIQAVRTLLPKCWFSETKTSQGLEALRQYRKEMDFKGETFKSKAVHDWSSHPADSFRTLATGLYGDVTRQSRAVRAEMEYDVFDPANIRGSGNNRNPAIAEGCDLVGSVDDNWY